MKRARLTLILFLALAALAAYVFFYERGEAPEGRLALRFAPDQVTEIRVSRGAEGQMRLVRKGEAWRMTRPISARADKQTVTQLLDDLKRLTDEGKIGESPKDLKPYGLDKPSTTLTLLRRKKSSLTLLLGDKTPDNANAYARLKGSPRVFMVRGFVADQIARDPRQFRDQTVLPFAVDKVRRIALLRGEDRITAERDEQGEWRLTEPVETAGDAMALDDLLSAAHDLKASEFVADRSADPAAYALDKPSLQVRLWSKGRSKPRTIAFGGTAPADRVYARTSEEPQVVAVARANVAKLDKATRDLRSKEVLAFDHDRVTRLRLKAGPFEVEIAREGAADERHWRMVKPSKAEADEGTVDDVLYALSGLRAEEFIDAPQPLRDYALQHPRVEAALSIKGRKTPLRLLVGKEAGEGQGVFAKRGDLPTVYRVSSNILSDLAPDPQRFRSRQVLKVNRDDIERIVLSHEKTRVTIERKGRDRWEITSPRKVEADPGKVAGILFALEDLRGDELVAEAPADLAPYGLDKPRLTAEITVKGRREPERVLVGKSAPQGGKVYLKGGSAAAVYLKDRYLLDDLRKGVDDLKK